MSSPSDRNLLLGILALQMDFISREQLIAATSAWVADKTRPLDEILLAHASLDASTHALLVALVEKHLEMHSGEPEQSLAAVSSLGSVRDALSKLGDADVAASMSLVAIDREAVDPYETQIPSSGPGGALEPRFRVLRPHAKGGLGEVFVARDDELNREVALKEIRAAHAHNSESRSRFTLEAEVTGGLEHPGIVPVYGLGQYGDGRPYYAMRFIRGDSLGEALDRFHGQSASDPSDDESVSYDSVEFRKLLGRFVDVCNAIQYAHSRGVLHRDLKPGNIMLGKYGETLVVDWGLAKLQGREDKSKVAGETTLQPRSASGSTPTQFGSALGTPAYMPPEQAAGKLNELGPESDVYSLGATLYHLLTGQPPVAGSDIGQLLKRVQQGDFRAPRQVKANVPKALDAICLHAMATDPRDRYATPQELADDVERFLADEPAVAYTDPPLDRARRWVRKHQTVATTTAAVLLLSAVGMGVFSAVVSSTNTKLAESKTKLEAANKREKTARERAENSAKLARLHGDLTFATLASVVNDIQGGLSKLPGGGEIRRRLLKTSLAKLELIVSDVEPGRADHQRVRALFELGDVVLQFGSEDVQDPTLEQSAVEVASKFYRRAHSIAKKLAANDPRDRTARRDLSASYGKLGEVQIQSGKFPEAMALLRESLKIAAAHAAEVPDDATLRRDLFVAYHRLGNGQLETRASSEALESFQECVSIAEQLAEDDPDDPDFKKLLAIAYNKLGDAQLRQGDAAAAMGLYQQSLTLKENLGSGDPDGVETQRDVFISYNKFAKVQIELGQLTEALASCRKSLAIAKKLALDDPNDMRAQRDLTMPLSKIGDIQVKQGKLLEALASYQEVLKLDQKSAQADPNDYRVHLDLAISHQVVGEVNEALHEFEAAAQAYEAGAVVARHMLDRGMSVEQAEKYLRFYVKAAVTARQTPVAVGDWSTLLAQPAATLPTLLDLRSKEFVKRARFGEAAEAADKLRTFPNATPRQLYDASRIFEQCAASIQAKAGEALSAEQTKQREDYDAKRAATVRQAIITAAIQFGRPLSARSGIGLFP